MICKDLEQYCEMSKLLTEISESSKSSATWEEFKGCFHHWIVRLEKGDTVQSIWFDYLRSKT